MVKVQVKFDANRGLDQAWSATSDPANRGTIYFVNSNNDEDIRILLNNKDYTGYRKPNGGIPITDLDSTTQGKINNGNNIYGELHNKKVTSWNNPASDDYFPSEKLVYDSLATKAPINSPSLSGTPTVPTPNGSNTSQIANVAYVNNVFAGLSGAMHFIGTSSTDPKVNGATVTGHSTWKAGDVVLYGNKEYVDTADGNTPSNWKELGDESSYKVKQSQVVDPAASGYTTAFISSISQNENGVISATKAYLPTTSTTVFNRSGEGHSMGLVPDPGSVQGYDRYLCEDGNWHKPSNATTSSAGYMSADDKTKLNSVITTNATTDSSGYMSASDKTKLNGLTSGTATTSTAGYMSAADKTKLDNAVVASVHTAGNIVTWSGSDAQGGTIMDSEKSFTASISASPTDYKIPTEKAVSTAIATALEAAKVYWED